MTDKTEIIQVIYNAIDELNQQLPRDRQLVKSVHTTLASKMGGLDSLALVNLVVLTEEQIEDAFGALVNLADQKAMAQTNSPFQTVDTLANYISSLLPEQKNGITRI